MRPGNRRRQRLLLPRRRCGQANLPKAPVDAVPDEFLPRNVAALSSDEHRLKDAEWFASGEPFRSMQRQQSVAQAAGGWERGAGDAAGWVAYRALSVSAV